MFWPTSNSHVCSDAPCTNPKAFTIRLTIAGAAKMSSRAAPDVHTILLCNSDEFVFISPGPPINSFFWMTQSKPSSELKCQFEL